jgi:transcriptional regulator with XRE-family HTH domain
MFLTALREVAQARTMSRVARDAGITRESLYRATSGEGNPTLDTLDSVLDVLGMGLTVEAKTRTRATGLQSGSGKARVGHGRRSETKNQLRGAEISYGVSQLSQRSNASMAIPSRAFFGGGVISVGSTFDSGLFQQSSNEELWTINQAQERRPPPNRLITELPKTSSLGMPTIPILNQAFTTCG